MAILLITCIYGSICSNLVVHLSITNNILYGLDIVTPEKYGK